MDISFVKYFYTKALVDATKNVHWDFFLNDIYLFQPIIQNILTFCFLNFSLLPKKLIQTM